MQLSRPGEYLSFEGVRIDDSGIAVEHRSLVFDERVVTGLQDDGLIAVEPQGGEVDDDAARVRGGDDDPEVSVP